MSAEASLLRLLTCGSVDDGKSTLIGRLLYDTKLLLDDQLSSLKQDSRKFGTTGGDFDFALLVDGLESEREQGITIDVAYRYFATGRRKFIVADTPGHEQYTRNMATGASTSDLAVLLIDARKGVSNQTRRHAYIVSLLGIRHIVLAVNKIDLVEYSRGVFENIIADFQAFAQSLQFRSIVPIPVSARFGDNVISVSAHTPWHTGPSLLDHLEAVDVGAETKHGSFRMPVQWVNRPTLDFRGYAGTIVGGSIKVGQTVAVASSGRTSEIKRIVTLDGDCQEANTGDAVTVMLKDEIDISRGDVFCRAKDRPEVSDQFVAHLLWMVDEPLLPGRQYILKLATSTVTAQVTALKHKVDVDNLDRLAAKTLHLNEIGLVNIALGRPIAFDAYDQNRATGGFILIDRYSNATVGAGMVEFGLRRAANVHWQALDINKQVRAQHKAQKPVVLWFTGLSGSGKSTIANLVERMLFENGRHTYLLDGDNVRHGLNRDLGFTQEDRVENIRRIGETAKLFVDAGLIVLVSFISPFKSERQMARDLLPEGEFIEIFINTPFEVCAARDPKGLYKKAMAGQLKNFTGLDSPYEPPQNPDIVINTLETEPAESAERIVRFLSDRGY